MIFLRGNVPSLKNGKVKGIFHPKTVTKYLRSLNIQDYSARKGYVKGYVSKDKPNLFIKYVGDYFKNINYPMVLGLHFVRNSAKRLFDFNNANHIITDLLTAHNFIEDDNMKYLIPTPFKINGKWYSVDKKNPGVWLKILDPNDFLDIKIT